MFQIKICLSCTIIIYFLFLLQKYTVNIKFCHENYENTKILLTGIVEYFSICVLIIWGNNFFFNIHNHNTKKFILAFVELKTNIASE